MEQAIELRDVTFGYRKNPVILNIPELAIAAGDRVFLHGPSGCGKTTMLGLVGGILAPLGGHINILGTAFSTLNATKRDVFRGAHIGFIFQMFNLIPYLSVIENIILPCAMNDSRRRRIATDTAVQEAKTLAEHLRIHDLLGERVTDLSVGQQQRVAAARALIGRPEIVIADEPTSALDADHRETFIKLLFEVCGTAGATLLFVSHDLTLARLFSRSISLPALNRAKR